MNTTWFVNNIVQNSFIPTNLGMSSHAISLLVDSLVTNCQLTITEEIEVLEEPSIANTGLDIILRNQELGRLNATLPIRETGE